MSRPGRSMLSLLLVTATLVLGGCDRAEDEDVTLLVSAASSLTESMTELARAFEETREGVVVELNFGASSTLATQIVEGGAPVDVFASANEAQMQRVVDAGGAQTPRVFAHNGLVVVVPAESPITSFESLATPGVRLVLAAPDVPIGAYARGVVGAADADGRFGAGFGAAVLANVVSEEANVRQVLTKVELGEADAGIVYATDATANGDRVQVVPIPTEFAPLAVYPIAIVEGSAHRESAQAFVDFVLSGEGQAVLGRYGFVSP